jgi:hypothetical protein
VEKKVLDFTHWFQRELAKLDRKIMKTGIASEQKEKFWAERKRMFDERSYADNLYQAYQNRLEGSVQVRAGWVTLDDP